MGINRELWLKAVSDIAVPVEDPDAISVSEMAALCQCGVFKARQKLLALEQAGEAERIVKWRTDSTGGRRAPVTAWRLVTKGGAHGTDHNRPRRRRHA